jgi:hypothetical protein
MKCRQRDEQRREHGTRDQLPWQPRSIVKDSAHDITLRERPRRNRALYISYKTIA